MTHRQQNHEVGEDCDDGQCGTYSCVHKIWDSAVHNPNVDLPERWTEHRFGWHCGYVVVARHEANEEVDVQLCNCAQRFDAFGRDSTAHAKGMTAWLVSFCE